MELNFSDLTLVLFAFICIWMALEISGGGGGGHRARVPVRF
jgi:hypothetical protein